MKLRPLFALLTSLVLLSGCGGADNDASDLTQPTTLPTSDSDSIFPNFAGKYSLFLDASGWACRPSNGGSVNAFTSTMTISQNQNYIYVPNSKVELDSRVSEVKSTSDISGQIQRSGKFLLSRDSTYVLDSIVTKQVYEIEGTINKKYWSGRIRTTLTRPDEPDYICFLDRGFSGDWLE